MADDLGTAVLRITVNDEAARESLRLLRQDIQRSTRVGGGRGGRFPYGDPQSVRTLEQAQERRFRLAQRIQRLEDQGANVSRLRARLGEATTAQANREFEKQRRISVELNRQVRLAEARLQRERQLDAALTRQARIGGARESIRGRVGLTGSPADLAFLARQGGARSPIGGAVNIPGSPAAIRAEERLAAARQRAAQAAEKASQAEGRRIGRLNAVPLRGGAAFPGSPEFLRAALPALPSGFFANQRRALDAAARAGGPRSPIGGGIGFPGSPGFFPAALPALPSSYFANQRRQLAAAARRRQDVASNALIGGAFPLLFGQGIGAAVGGGLGGAAGGAIGGQFGFGLSLLGTAVGAQFDALLEKGRTLAAALSDPIARFGELQQAGLLSSSALERSVQALIDIGSAATAAALIQKDLEAQYGASAVSAAKFFRAQAEVANRSDRQTDVTLGPFFDFLGAELQRAGRRITEPGFGLFPSAADRNRPDAEKRAADEVQNAQVRIQRIENQRLATQGKQLSSIAAQAQGYEGVAAALDNQVRAELNAADIADARRRKAEVQGDSPKAQAERAEIQREINRLIDEGTRGQQKYNEAQKAAATNAARQLALTKQLVQVNPEERGFVQQRLDIKELERQLGVTRAAAAAAPGDTGLRDAVTALENELLTKQLTLQDQLLRFQRDRAAIAQLQVANYKLEAQALDRQFNTAKRIAAFATTGGVTVARDAAQFRSGLGEQVRQAQENEARIAAQIQAEQLRGGDGSAERIRQLQLDQVNAARETRNLIFEAATQLRDAGQQLARNLRDAVTNFTAIRSDPQGLNRFLSPQAQANRAQGDFRLLLPQFRNAQAQFERLTGERAPEFTGTTAGVNAAIRDFINAVNAEDVAQQVLIQTNEALQATNDALATWTAKLVGQVARLADKDWNVEVFVNGAPQDLPLPAGGLP